MTFLPACASSNEALHAESKSWFLQIQQIHKSTLHLKLLILTLSKALPHALAMQVSTISQTNSRLLLATANQHCLKMSEEEWQRWCASCMRRYIRHGYRSIAKKAELSTGPPHRKGQAAADHFHCSSKIEAACTRDP